MHFSNPAVAASLLLSLSALGSAQTTDEFTVSCNTLTIQRSDPIVDPGEASGHVHVVAGGTAFQRTMDQDTAKNSMGTTCDKDIDKSSYWVPQLYHQTSDGKFEIVENQGNAAYYLNRACNYTSGATECDNDQNKIVAMAPPAGLRMVAGDPELRTYDDSNVEQQAISHMCLKEGGSTETKSLPQEHCLRMRSQVYFPSCWNGQDLDSDDHKSHMAYPDSGYNGGVCPQSHPIAIYSLFYEFFFDTSPFEDYENLVYAMGDPTGYGFHGDFINGWTDQAALQDAFATCTGPDGMNAPECSLGKGEASDQEPEVAEPDEDVGLDSPLDKLPGDNPVTGGNSTMTQSRIYRRRV
ncbi:hypothetical protein FQN54_002838 [Arachnomyces sp. PD_36]|nr:hypothetical protein FQN54_002838 [Arachnomyces sp. PD_36]